jgi:hypothetical protein
MKQVERYFRHSIPRLPMDAGYFETFVRRGTGNAEPEALGTGGQVTPAGVFQPLPIALHDKHILPVGVPRTGGRVGY